MTLCVSSFPFDILGVVVWTGLRSIEYPRFSQAIYEVQLVCLTWGKRDRHLLEQEEEEERELEEWYGLWRSSGNGYITSGLLAVALTLQSVEMVAASPLGNPSRSLLVSTHRNTYAEAFSPTRGHMINNPTTPARCLHCGNAIGHRRRTAVPMDLL